MRWGLVRGVCVWRVTSFVLRVYLGALRGDLECTCAAGVAGMGRPVMSLFFWGGGAVMTNGEIRVGFLKKGWSSKEQ